MSTNQNPKEKLIRFDFYICFNDLCSYLGIHHERSAGDPNMKTDTIPAGYYQGNPICRWCNKEMDVAHTENTARPPHIEWDGITPEGELYYQLKLF